jgi:tape measure domain-containing protein
LAKVQNEMATKISLDTITATNSLKGLTSAVSAATSSFKANAAMLASTGDMVGSYSEKVNGLSKAMELQQSKIDALRSRQEGLDVTTQSGAEQYQKLEKQIATATRQMASMESQQDRAKNSLSYYTSGLADLQRGYETAQKSSQAYVNRLEAEGKQEEANKARMSGLKQSLSNLSFQYEKQESELQKIASTSGSTSEAYLKQKTRLNETGTAVAETKTKISELNDQMKTAPTGFFAKLKSGFSQTGKEAEETGKKVHIGLGVFIGNALTNGIAQATSYVKEFATQGFESAEAATEVAEKWKNMGASESDIKAMGVSVKSLKENTNLSGTAVANLTTKFYDMTGSASKTNQLAQGVGSLSDKLKLTNTQADGFANGLSKIEASGTVTSSSLGRIEKQAPGLGTALQQASGMSKTAFDSLVSSGKMTSTQFNNILQKASKDYKKNSSEFDESSQGALKHIQQSWADTKQALMTPLVNVAATGLSSISKVLETSAVQSAIKQLGTGIANITTKAAGLISYLAGHASAINGIVSSIVQIAKLFAEGVWDTFKGVVTGISNVFDDMSSKSKKAHDPLNNLSSVLKAIASHKAAIKAIGATIAAGFAAAKVIKGIQSMVSGFQALRTVFAAGIPLNIWVIAITAVIAGFVELYKHSAKFRAFVNDLVKSAQKFATDVGKWFGKAWSAVKKGVSDTINFVKKNWAALALMLVNPIAGSLVLLYNNNSKFRKWANDLWAGVKSAFKAGWNASVNVIKSGIKLAENLWNSFKTGVKNIVTALGKDIVSAWNAIKNFTVSVFTATKNLAINIWTAYENTIKSICTAIKTAVISIWNGIKSALLAIVNGIWNGTKIIFNELKKWSIDIFNGLKTGLINIWNAVKSSLLAIVNGIWTGIKNVFTTLKNWSIDIFNGLKTGVVSIWNGLKNSLSDVANGIWKGIKSVFTTMYDWLNKITGGRLGDVLNTFKSVFSSISGVVSGAVKAIHTAFVDVVRGIAKPFNELLSGLEKGINWVLDKVGASKIKGTWSIPLPAYATGTGGILKDQLALVNDAKGSNYREMYHTPDGKIGMFPAQRNMIVPLKAGTEILDGDNSARLANLMGLQKYASGSIGSFFSGIFNKGKDLLEDADKIIAHPAQFLESVFTKFTSSISSGAGLASDIITNLPSTIAKSAISWIKNLFSEDAGGSSANPSGSGVQRWKDDVIKALKANGLSTSSDMVNKVLRQISTESGGNPNAKQPGSDPDGDGSGPALGLMQTKRSTFNANKFSGHGSIFNGYDNLLAALKYAKARYGSSLSYLGNGHGYANGGIVSNEGLYTLAEGNKPEFVIPTDYTKHNRAVELLNQAKTAITGTGLSDDTSQKLDTLIEQNKQLITLLAALAQGSQVVLDTGALVGGIYSTLKNKQASELNISATGTAIKVGG